MTSKAKIRQCPKNFLLFLKDKWSMDKGTLKLVSYLFGKGRYLTTKFSNIWRSKNSHLFMSINWQAADQIDCHLFLAFTIDKPMCAKLGSNRLNTVVFRASYILPILRQYSWQNLVKPGVVTYIPPERSKTETNLSFWVLG